MRDRLLDAEALRDSSYFVVPGAVAARAGGASASLRPAELSFSLALPLCPCELPSANDWLEICRCLGRRHGVAARVQVERLRVAIWREREAAGLHCDTFHADAPALMLRSDWSCDEGVVQRLQRWRAGAGAAALPLRNRNDGFEHKLASDIEAEVLRYALCCVEVWRQRTVGQWLSLCGEAQVVTQTRGETREGKRARLAGSLACAAPAAQRSAGAA